MPRQSRYLLSLSVFALALSFARSAGAQQSSSPPLPDKAEKSNQNIADDWGSLLHDTIPQTQVDPNLAVPQNAFEHTAGQDFLDHFFYESRLDYIRTQTYFTGNPTATGVIDGPPSPVQNPNGIVDPAVFQPSTNMMYAFMNWGTRGWLSDRLNTNFSFRYEQNLTHVDDGSPGQSILTTFPSSRRLELLSGYAEIQGRASDGVFAGTSLRLGRQNIYGAEVASLDGASFTMARKRYSYTIFGGRRFTYYSDPAQRAIGGGSLDLHFGDSGIFQYEALFYIKGSQVFSYRQRFGRSWMFSTYYKMIGGAAIDYGANAIWTPGGSGKTMVRLGYLQKLTDQDYFYDYTEGARDHDIHNPVLRLNLGTFSPYSQFLVDARRTVNSRVLLSGGVIVLHLNDSSQQGPFDTSYQDYRADAQVYPGRQYVLFFEYHERDSDRLSSANVTQLSDISTTGETKIRDFSVELGHTYMDGRLTLKAGGFFRLLNFQDAFTIINGAHDFGMLATAQFKLDRRTRFYLDYGLDSDYFVFRPDIQNAQTFRVGMAWTY